MRIPSLHYDVGIVGGGLAGLSLALRLADENVDVVLITKGTLTEGSSLYAQGGIAAVVDESDSIQSHIDDTLNAGGGLCRPETVKHVIRHGPQSIQWLTNKGVQFSLDEDDEELHLTQEGGHSHRRVVHAQDATGRAVVETLEALVRNHSKIRLLEDHVAIDIVTSRKLNRSGANQCIGLYVLDQDSGEVVSINTKELVLASGGTSKVYLYTTNPDTSTGDGIAIAWRAGCRVANMEFIQFHPTCLYHPHAKSFLISEAVRGEGGRLCLPDGSGFMQHHDPRQELAPRDIVARAIDYEMKRGGFDCVFIDISHQSREFIETHFPNIHRRCLEFGIDMTTDPIPVVPAAHYTCGGIVTDLRGRTDLLRLHAIGECTYTGLHGANRLASNSLLECLVFAEKACDDIIDSLKHNDYLEIQLPEWDASRVTDPDEQIIVSHNWDELRRFMWDYVGIVRTDKRLERARHRVELLQEEIRDYYSNFNIDNDLVELRNLVLVAELIILSALKRKESRGLHFTLDYPETMAAEDADNTVLVPDSYNDWIS